MHKVDLALNNLEGLICHKNQHSQNQLKYTFESKITGLDSLFYGISTFVGYLMPKPSL